MTDAAAKLSDALGALLSSVDDTVMRRSAFTEACMDQQAYEDDRNPATARAMSRSAEELLDTLSIMRIARTPQHAAAETALEAHLRAR